MFTRALHWLERRIDVFAPFDENETPPTDVRAFIWHYVRPFRLILFIAAFLIFLVGVSEASMLLLVGHFIDLLGRTEPAALFSDHPLTLGLFAAFVVLVRPGLLIAAEMLVNQALVTPVICRVRWQTHLYTLRHALSYFQNDFAGRLSNRIMQAGPGVQAVAFELVNAMIYVAIYATVTFVAFMNVNVMLSLPILLWAVCYVLLVRHFVPRAVHASRTQSEARSIVAGRIVDSYTNIQTVKLFARTEHERNTVRKAISHHLRKGLDVFNVLTKATAILIIMNTLMLFGTACIALMLWQSASITLGAVASGLALVMRLTDMSRWVMQIVRGIFENLGTVQESMETIARPHALVDRADATALTVTQGEIVFENVSFHYGKSGGVIDNLSLRIAPGEKVGLIGPSGAGKSTITSLLLRLYDVEGGRILIDGQDIAQVTQDSLRAQIGVVTQDNSLLHRSISTNIAYGRANASDDDIMEAARQARAHDFIVNLADRDGHQGYDSRVGERGVKLSGGQRQRIAIARVLLKDAPILVLDEATSALDSQVESSIQHQLQSLMKGKTVIAIAHRLSTIAAMDRLIVMDEGKIVESGSHHELVAQGGLYAALWAHQSGGFLSHEQAA